MISFERYITYELGMTVSYIKAYSKMSDIDEIIESYIDYLDEFIGDDDTQESINLYISREFEADKFKNDLKVYREAFNHYRKPGKNSTDKNKLLHGVKK